ncbi:response regulator transcription factor [Achromobacter sp. AGC39]
MRVPRPDLDVALAALTPREKQIVDYVAAGRPNKVIAIDLGISLRTAEAHRARIFAKLNTRNAMELACRLCAHGRSGASPILEAAAVDAALAAGWRAEWGPEPGAEWGAATASRPAPGMAGNRPMNGPTSGSIGGPIGGPIGGRTSGLNSGLTSGLTSGLNSGLTSELTSALTSGPTSGLTSGLTNVLTKPPTSPPSDRATGSVSAQATERPLGTPADANLSIGSQPIVPGIYSAAMFPTMASSTTLHEPPLEYGVDPALVDDSTDDAADDPADDSADDDD